MQDILRQEIATAAQTIVVKVGTNVLTDTSGRLDDRQIARLSEEIHDVIASGRQVVLVSSGAVGAGVNQLGLPRRPNDLAQLQAVAAVGQAKLIESYDRNLARYNRHAAQVLLTSDDFDDRARYLNVRNTLYSLLKMGAVPIINENDTVAVEELQTTFGDNDRLAAMVTNLLRAPLLVILSDVEGLFDGNPEDAGSTIVPTVTSFSDTIWGYVRDRRTGNSKGGMASKLEAARITTSAGENVIVASGHKPGIIRQILAGEVVGTLFVAQGKSVSPWKRWIGFSAQPRGRLTLDEGARRAIQVEGRSLLPIGVTAVSGQFRKGDVVSLLDANGDEFGRGLVNYSSEDAHRIAGLQSDKISGVLGYSPYQEILHRDNIAVF